MCVHWDNKLICGLYYQKLLWGGGLIITQWTLMSISKLECYRTKLFNNFWAIYLFKSLVILYFVVFFILSRATHLAAGAYLLSLSGHWWVLVNWNVTAQNYSIISEQYIFSSPWLYCISCFCHIKPRYSSGCGCSLWPWIRTYLVGWVELPCGSFGPAGVRSQWMGPKRLYSWRGYGFILCPCNCCWRTNLT